MTGGDVVDGKETDTNVSVDIPLLRLTVGLAAVVHETRVIALRPSIDDPSNINRWTRLEIHSS